MMGSTVYVFAMLLCTQNDLFAVLLITKHPAKTLIRYNADEFSLSLGIYVIRYIFSRWDGYVALTVINSNNSGNIRGIAALQI